MPRYFFRLEKSTVSAIPRAFQLALASLAATTGVKSAAYSMGRWRFTELLAVTCHDYTSIGSGAIMRPNNGVDYRHKAWGLRDTFRSWRGRNGRSLSSSRLRAST